MKVKVFFGILSIVVIGLLFVSGAQARRGSIDTVDQLFTAVNTGELEVASDLFAADAVVSYTRTNKSYEGPGEIGHFLESLHYEGRTFEIVQASVEDDTVKLTVDVADRGHVWGQQTLEVKMQGRQIKSFEVIETRLTLWRISS